MEIDIIIDVELDKCDRLKSILEDYFKFVYTKNESIEINIGHGLYNGRLGNFDYSIFEECLNRYDPSHTNNKKSWKEAVSKRIGTTSFYTYILMFLHSWDYNKTVE